MKIEINENKSKRYKNLVCGQCYYYENERQYLYYVAHIFDTDFSKFDYCYLINMETGEAVCKCDTLEELSKSNIGLEPVESKVVINLN